jgi:hypothetical protein
MGGAAQINQLKVLGVRQYSESFGTVLVFF